MIDDLNFWVDHDEDMHWFPNDPEELVCEC